MADLREEMKRHRADSDGVSRKLRRGGITATQAPFAGEISEAGSARPCGESGELDMIRAKIASRPNVPPSLYGHDGGKFDRV